MCLTCSCQLFANSCKQLIQWQCTAAQFLRPSVCTGYVALHLCIQWLVAYACLDHISKLAGLCSRQLSVMAAGAGLLVRYAPLSCQKPRFWPFIICSPMSCSTSLMVCSDCPVSFRSSGTFHMGCIDAAQKVCPWPNECMSVKFTHKCQAGADLCQKDSCASQKECNMMQPLPEDSRMQIRV